MTTAKLGRVTALLGLLLFASSAFAEERPEWCRAGYVCLRTEVAEQRERKIIRLELELAERKASRVKRLGFTVGPSLVYSSSATDTFLPIVPGFGVTWGLRF